MDLGLEGKVVLITDGARSIGRATAVAFAREGARVAVTYPPGVPQEDIDDALGPMGGDAIALPLDLADPASIEAAVAGTLDRFGGIDTFVANAIQWGDASPGAYPSFADAPAAVWQPFLRANLDGVLLCLQHVIPAMKGRGSGRIVFLSSEAVRHGFPGSVFYSAAKAALEGITTGLVAELEGEALINIVAPGMVLTSSTLASATPEQLEARAAITPTRRLTKADDVARIVVFYGSPANGNVTGDTVNVTGGR